MLKSSKSRPAPLAKGAIIGALRSLKPGESVVLPTSSQSACNTVGHLIRNGEAKRGDYTVRAEPDGRACVWRLK